MASFLIRPALKIRGRVVIPSDKSITHRAIILASIAEGLTKIKNFSKSLDCFYTLKIFKQLGIKAKKNKNEVLIEGKGLFGLMPSKKPLFVGESGTTVRILLGILAGQNFNTKIVAAPALNKRPMARVIKPLRMMGAKIKAKVKRQKEKVEYYPPITIWPSALKGISYKLEVPSAQVKSAILLAGLYAKGETKVIEQVVSRDHTEKMLKFFGADLKIKKQNNLRIISIDSAKPLKSPGEVVVCGDISSAMFFIVAGLIVPNSNLTLKSVGLNPTRIGALKVLKRMKADIKIKNYRIECGEPIGDIVVRSVGAHRDAPLLSATKIKHSELPLLIDELPILMVAASCAIGTTIIERAGELRVKETDRINSMVTNLKNMGANIDVKTDDTIVIKGPVELSGARLKSFGDHRTAMSMAIAALCADKPSYLDDISCAKKSFPEFKELFFGLTQGHCLC